MGAFFLLGGTVLFLAGLGCLVVVFVSITRRLKASRNPSAYFRNRSSYQEGILSGLGICLIIAAQGFFWFDNEVEKFVPFEESVPQIQLSFVFEELRTPRMMLESTDRNHQLNTQTIPLPEGKIEVAVETITWKRVFRILGLKDCYRISGLYYETPGSIAPRQTRTPDYALNGGPSGLASFIGTLGKAIPANHRFLVSEPLAPGSDLEYLVQITPTLLYCTRSVDSEPTAHYPK